MVEAPRVIDYLVEEHDHGPSSVGSSALVQQITLQLLVSVDLSNIAEDEKEPFLTGLDFLQDGRLVTVDKKNWKCIILNDQLQIQGTPYKFKTHPYGVVVLSKYEFAVTVGNKTVCLLFVSTDNAISLITELNTSSSFKSICRMTSSNMIVSTFYDPRPVRIISVNGEESEFDQVVFPGKTNTCGKSNSTYVQSNNTLVITDRPAHTVYMYNTVNGTSRAVRDENIQKPRGVCVGPGDTVLVCSKDNNSIVHLTVDGYILGTYPVDMKRPFSLCMNRDGTRLAVSNKSKADPSSVSSSALFQEFTLQPLVSVDKKQTEDDMEEPLLTGLDFRPDGRLVAVITLTGNVSYSMTGCTDKGYHTDSRATPVTL